MCRPPEPCIPGPPSADARRYGREKQAHAAGYGGGFQYQTYSHLSAARSSHAAADNSICEYLDREHRNDHRYCGGYHGDECRPQHQREQQFSHSLPYLYGSISTSELLEVLAKRGLYDWDIEPSALSSVSASRALPFGPAPSASPSINSSNNGGLERVGGGAYASSASVTSAAVADAVILGNRGGDGASAAVNYPPSDLPVGAIKRGPGSGRACQFPIRRSTALAAATDKSRAQERRNSMPSSSQSHMSSSRPAYGAMTSESLLEPQLAAKDADIGSSTPRPGHGGVVPCTSVDGRVKYLSQSRQQGASETGASLGYGGDHFVIQRQHCLAAASAALTTVLSVSQRQTGTPPHAFGGDPSSSAAAPPAATAGTDCLVGIFSRNTGAEDEVVCVETEGSFSVADNGAADAERAIVGVPASHAITGTSSSSMTVAVGNFVPSSELEKGSTSASTAAERDLDNWIEEFLTSDPLPESVMSSLDCVSELSPMEAATMAQAGGRMLTLPLPTFAASHIPGRATTTSPCVVEDVDQLLTRAVPGPVPGPVGLVSGRVSVTLAEEGAGRERGDSSDDQNDNLDSCSVGGRTKRQDEDGHHSDSQLESLTDEERKRDAPSLSHRSPSHYAGQPDKKTKRMLSNRESARRSRQRRQELMDTLELEAARLRVENAALVRRARETAKTLEECKQQNNSLNEELNMLRRKLCFYEPPSGAGGVGTAGADSIEKRVGGGVTCARRGGGEEETCVTKDTVMRGNDEEDEESHQVRCVKKARRSSGPAYATSGLEEDRHSDRGLGSHQNSHSPVKSLDCGSLSGGGSALTSSQLSLHSSNDEGKVRVATCYSPWYRCDEFSGMVDMSKNGDEDVLDDREDMVVKEPHIWSRREGGGFPVVRAH